MDIRGKAKLLRIFIGESDKVNHVSLSDAIIAAARKQGMAGATAWRGTASFGPSSHIRSSHVLDLSADLPVIIELVDTEEKIRSFQDQLTSLFDEAHCGGLVTIEETEVIRYSHGTHAQ